MADISFFKTILKQFWTVRLSFPQKPLAFLVSTYYIILVPVPFLGANQQSL